MTTTAVVCCSGVAQAKWPSDGMGELCEKLHGVPGVTAFLRRRHDSERDMAITLEHEHDFDRIILSAHSEGARWCRDVARDLNEFGRIVDYLFLSDGWIKGGKLLIPANVLRVEAWIQSTERPKWKRHPHGSEIVLESAATEFVLAEAPVDVGHIAMDGLPEFHAAVIAAAKGA